MKRFIKVSAICFFILLPFKAGAHYHEAEFSNNGYLVDGTNAPGEFAIYRMGFPARPGKNSDEKSKMYSTLPELCTKGIHQMVVVSGNADLEESQLTQVKENAPALNLCQITYVYNFKQWPTQSMSKEFLDFIVHWVQLAKIHKEKIGFRCNCGCHRTGRLAAFYEIYFKGKLEGQPLSLEDVVHELIEKAHGENPEFFPPLTAQVTDLYNCFIKEKKDIASCEQIPHASSEELLEIQKANDKLNALYGADSETKRK